MTQPRGKQINNPQLVYLDEANYPNSVTTDGAQGPTIARITSTNLNPGTISAGSAVLVINGTNISFSINAETSAKICEYINALTSTTGVSASLNSDGYIQLTRSGGTISLSGSSSATIFGNDPTIIPYKAVSTTGKVVATADGGGLFYLRDTSGIQPVTSSTTLYRISKNTDNCVYTGNVLPGQRVFGRITGSTAFPVYSYKYQGSVTKPIRGKNGTLTNINPGDNFKIKYRDLLSNYTTELTVSFGSTPSTRQGAVDAINASIWNQTGNVGMVVGRTKGPAISVDGTSLALKIDNGSPITISFTNEDTLTAVAATIHNAINTYGACSVVSGYLKITSNTTDNASSSVEIVSISDILSNAIGVTKGLYKLWVPCKLVGGDIEISLPHAHAEFTLTEVTSGLFAKLGFGGGYNTDITSTVQVSFENREIPTIAPSSQFTRIIPAYLEFGDIPDNVAYDVNKLNVDSNQSTPGSLPFTPAILNDQGKIRAENIPAQLDVDTVNVKNLNLTTAVVDDIVGDRVTIQGDGNSDGTTYTNGIYLNSDSTKLHSVTQIGSRNTSGEGQLRILHKNTYWTDGSTNKAAIIDGDLTITNIDAIITDLNLNVVNAAKNTNVGKYDATANGKLTVNYRESVFGSSANVSTTTLTAYVKASIYDGVEISKTTNDSTRDNPPLKVTGALNSSLNLAEWYKKTSQSASSLVAYLDKDGFFGVNVLRPVGASIHINDNVDSKPVLIGKYHETENDNYLSTLYRQTWLGLFDNRNVNEIYLNGKGTVHNKLDIRKSDNSTDPVVTIKRKSQSDTSNLTIWKDQDNNPLAYVDSTGKVFSNSGFESIESQERVSFIGANKFGVNNNYNTPDGIDSIYFSSWVGGPVTANWKIQYNDNIPPSSEEEGTTWFYGSIPLPPGVEITGYYAIYYGNLTSSGITSNIISNIAITEINYVQKSWDRFYDNEISANYGANFTEQNVWHGRKVGESGWNTDDQRKDTNRILHMASKFYGGHDSASATDRAEFFGFVIAYKTKVPGITLS